MVMISPKLVKAPQITFHTDQSTGLRYMHYKEDCVTKTHDYLQVLRKPTAVCWFAREVMGETAIGNIIGKVMALVTV